MSDETESDYLEYELDNLESYQGIGEQVVIVKLKPQYPDEHAIGSFAPGFYTLQVCRLLRAFLGS